MESSQTENVIIIDGQNECNMEDENLNFSFQIEKNMTKQTNVKINVFNERNKMERNLQTLHAQRKIQKGPNRKTICQVFYCVKDDKEINFKNLQVIER